MNLNTLSSFLILPVVFYSRNIDFSEGSDNLWYIRVLFVVVQVLLFAFSFFLKQKIDAARQTPNSMKVIKVPVPKV